MSLSESDTRAKLIDPALYVRGWKEDFVKREETAGAVEVRDGRPHRRSRGRVDYMLRVKVTGDSQPVAIALIEAKAEHLPPEHGLEQAKVYAACKRLNVPFVLSTNGHLLAAFQNVFGADAAEVSGKNPQKNARILIATYQTLGIDDGSEGHSAAVPLNGHRSPAHC